MTCDDEGKYNSTATYPVAFIGFLDYHPNHIS